MSKDNPSLVQVDMRGFQYALKPFVQKQEWIKESLQRKLSKVQSALTDAQDELMMTQGRLEAQSMQIQQALLKHPDPVAHQRGLEFLVSLLQSIEAQKQAIEKLQTEKRAIQSEYLAQQCKLDGLNEHYVQAQQEFAVEQTRNAAAEADREWVGRMKHRGQRAPYVEDAL